MAKKQCGECGGDINDLEPVCCGFCESFYHIDQNCCGFKSRLLKEVFAAGKAMFICPPCRTELNGRLIKSYLAEKSDCQPNESPLLADLPGQVVQLSEAVKKLNEKIDTLASKPQQSTLASASTWPKLGVKNRREDRRADVDVPTVRRKLISMIFPSRL